MLGLAALELQGIFQVMQFHSKFPKAFIEVTFEEAPVGFRNTITLEGKTEYEVSNTAERQC